MTLPRPRSAAGTDCAVSIVLIGDRATSSEMRLENAEDNFSKGKTDVFRVHNVDVGELQKVGHNVVSGICSHRLLCPFDLCSRPYILDSHKEFTDLILL